MEAVEISGRVGPLGLGPDRGLTGVEDCGQKNEGRAQHVCCPRPLVLRVHLPDAMRYCVRYVSATSLISGDTRLLVVVRTSLY